MKKLLIILLFGMAIISCSKKDDNNNNNNNNNCPAVTTTAPAAEVATLKAYLLANNITAVEDPRGFFYTIASPGSGTKPTACSGIVFNYEGKLTNGTIFDSGNNASYYLNRLIIGWQEAIPLIAPGGSITLYLPPSLAYGSQATADGRIPANSILVFKIDLKAVY
jgi:FKBP-type peptidyl-prolyl cis-trans isomerase FkpA